MVRQATGRMKPIGSVKIAQGATPVGGEAGRCGPLKLNACNINRHKQKQRHGIEHEGHAGRGVVHGRVALRRLVDTEGNADEIGEHQCGEGEPERARNVERDDVPHREVQLVGVAQIEVAEDLDQIVPEPNHVGMIHPVLRAPLEHRAVVGVTSQYREGGRVDAPGLEIGERKCEEHHNQQNDQRLDESPNHVRQHWGKLYQCSAANFVAPSPNRPVIPE